LGEEEEAKRQSFAIPIDRRGKLSAPFMLGNRGNGEGVRRNNSRGPTVTWKDVSGVPLDGAWRRGSKSSEEDRIDPRLSRKSSRYESDWEREREKEKERDSGSSGSRRRRERGRDGEGDPVRPLLRERRYSSHDDVMRRHRDREKDYEREKEREREFAGRVFRDRDRARDRRGASPVRGVDGRKYPPAR
jgi:hypothetical protein